MIGANPPARVRALLALVLAVAGIAVAACTASKPKEPRGEQVYRFRLREDPPTLDPALVTDNLSEAVLMNLFRGLVAMDPATLLVTPAVAESWTVSDDGLTYTFRLRQDAYFHNGRRVTAEDVAWSFERLLRKETKSPRRWLLEPLQGSAEFSDGRAERVAGIEVDDERTLRLRLAKPFAPFLGMLTMSGAAIVPREVYDDPAKAYLRAPVGCGPFRLARWEQSNVIELLAFDRFYGGRPALDRVLVRIIENVPAGELPGIDFPIRRGINVAELDDWRRAETLSHVAIVGAQEGRIVAQVLERLAR